MRHGFALFFSFLLASRPLSAACEPSTTLARAATERGAWTWGVSLDQVLPNGVSNVEVAVLTVGPSVGVGTGPGSAFLKARYGTAPGVSLATGELGYRLGLENPFLRFFLEGGGYGLEYSTADSFSPPVFGGYLGYGITAPASESILVSVGLNLYFQARSLFSVYADIMW